MNGVILRNDTLFVVDGNYDFTRYNWQGEYLGKLFCPRIRHTLNFFLIPNTGMFLGHVDNHTGKKEVRFVFSEIRQQLRLFRIWINMSLLRQKSYIVHHPK